MSSETAGNNHEAAKAYYDSTPKEGTGGDPGAPGSRPGSLSAGQVDFQLPSGEGAPRDPMQKAPSKHSRTVSQSRLGERKPADGEDVWD